MINKIRLNKIEKKIVKSMLKESKSKIKTYSLKEWEYLMKKYTLRFTKKKVKYNDKNR